MKNLVFAIFLILGNQALAAEVYTWTDEHGRKHFSDSPPSADPENDVEVSKESYELENVGDGFPEYDSDRQLRARAARNNSGASGARATVKETLIERCRNTRRRLAGMRNGVSHRDANGDSVYVASSQLVREEKALRAEYERDCSDVSPSSYHGRPICPPKFSASHHYSASEYREMKKRAEQRCRESQKQWDRENRS